MRNTTTVSILVVTGLAAAFCVQATASAKSAGKAAKTMGYSYFASSIGVDNKDVTNFDDLELFGGITELDANNNLITDIDPTHFLPQPSIRTLNISTNLLTTIDNSDFAPLTAMTSLALDANQIHTLRTGAFQGLNNLQYLYLHSNPLTTIESGAFSDMSSLVEFEINNTPLTHLDFAQANFSAMEYFTFDKCKITSVDLTDAVISQAMYNQIMNNSCVKANVHSISVAGLQVDNIGDIVAYTTNYTALTSLTLGQEQWDNLSATQQQTLNAWGDQSPPQS